MAQSCGHCCVKIEDLSVQINHNSILENIHLHTNCKEILAIVGPNGAGKTTLLKAILGDIAYSGQITFQIRGAINRNPRIGYVPQKLNFDHDAPVSVQDLIAASLVPFPVWYKIRIETQNRVKTVLEKFSVDHLRKQTVGSLSGGELQRVLLAMAMTPTPDLLLLDEPGSAIDVKGLSLFYETITQLKEKYDISIVVVTHDLAGIIPYADRMILMNRSVLAEGTPREILSDKNLIEAFQLSLLNISRLLIPEALKLNE